MARILIATDAWHPQVNGVVRTLEMTATLLTSAGHDVEVLQPGDFPTIPNYFYPEIRISVPRPGKVYERIVRFRPTTVHIATEGPIGLLVRHFCRRHRWRFTTSFHTRFPEYLKKLAGVPESLSYRFLRWFHDRAARMMVATPSLEKELSERGFRAPMRRWSRGVDLTIFRPRPRLELGYPRPVLLYVGRVSKEKNIEDFLKINRSGTKLVIGDGPARAELERSYPEAVFLGYKTGQVLGEFYSAADLFVFPSKTDTFGMVVIEALASGLPVAAYPATGPIDIITKNSLGALDNDLGKAIDRALLNAKPNECIAEGQQFTWENCTKQFFHNLVAILLRK